MFYYGNAFDITGGNVAETFLGQFSPDTNNVVSGTLYIAESGTGTATFTLEFDGNVTLIFDLPTLDVSGAALTRVPFTLPFPNVSECSISFSVAVTGSSGRYGIDLFI